MKYRTKPFEIEAIQFDGNNFKEIQAWSGFHDARHDEHTKIMNFNPIGTFSMSNDPEFKAEIWDYLHETWVLVKAGNYIIKGMKGEFYPCDAEVFESKYEPLYNTGGMVESKDRSWRIDNCGYAEFGKLTDDS